ncbi:MAG: type II 3-dehydroquinate dehydratase, partial [Ilumatobacteraceae bacterium]
MASTHKRLLLLHGPNLNLLGTREPAIYGTATLADHVSRATVVANGLGYEVDSEQTNDLGALIGMVQQAGVRYAGIVMNAVAFTHFAWSLH